MFFFVNVFFMKKSSVTFQKNGKTSHKTGVTFQKSGITFQKQESQFKKTVAHFKVSEKGDIAVGPERYNSVILTSSQSVMISANYRDVNSKKCAFII